MVKQILELKKQLADEQALANGFQIEKERMKSFWLFDRKALDEVEAQIRNVERQREELAEAHQVQKQVCVQVYHCCCSSFTVPTGNTA